MPIEAVFLLLTRPVVPKASPATRPELAPSLAPFAPLWRRATRRASLERSVTGVRTDWPQKHGDTSAAAVAETSTARLHPL